MVQLLNRNFRLATIIFSLFGLVFQIAGCGSEGSLYDTSTASITIATSADRVEADGVSSVLITATVRDVTGNSVPAGTPVNFHTTLGHFANGGQHVTVEIVPGDISQTTSPRGGQGISSSGTNDGTAQVSLISSTEEGVAEVSVESLGVTQFVYITFGPVILPGNPEEIALSAASESIAGDESTTIIATVTPKAGDYLTLVGTAVTFSTTLGVFGNGSRSETAIITGTDGTAIVTLYANNETGTAVITASSGGIPSNTITVTLGESVGNVDRVSLSADATEITEDGQTVITATVTVTGDDEAALVGRVVTFTTTLGVFTNGQRSETAVITGTDGTAQVVLFGNNEPGTATVTASCEGVPSDTVRITITEN